MFGGKSWVKSEKSDSAGRSVGFTLRLEVIRHRGELRNKRRSCARRLLATVNIEWRGDPGGAVRHCASTPGGLFFADTGKAFWFVAMLYGSVHQGRLWRSFILSQYSYSIRTVFAQYSHSIRTVFAQYSLGKHVVSAKARWLSFFN